MDKPDGAELVAGACQWQCTEGSYYNADDKKCVACTEKPASTAILKGECKANLMGKDDSDADWLIPRTLKGAWWTQCKRSGSCSVGGACQLSGPTQAKVKFQSGMCTNNRLPVGDCLVGMTHMSQSGPDESYAAFGPNEAGGAHMIWTMNSKRGSSAGGVNIGASYVCPASKTGPSLKGHTKCSFKGNFRSKSRSYNFRKFEASECTNGLPTNSDCFATLSKARYGGNGANIEDESWQAYGLGTNTNGRNIGGAGIGFWTYQAENGELDVSVDLYSPLTFACTEKETVSMSYSSFKLVTRIHSFVVCVRKSLENVLRTAGRSCIVRGSAVVIAVHSVSQAATVKARIQAEATANRSFVVLHLAHATVSMI